MLQSHLKRRKILQSLEDKWKQHQPPGGNRLLRSRHQQREAVSRTLICKLQERLLGNAGGDARLLLTSPLHWDDLPI